MTKIISFLQQKGGCGKTTLSINFAMWLTRVGFKTLLIDADKQQTAKTWHELGDNNYFPVLSITGKTFKYDIEQFKGRFEVIVVDGSPRTNESTAQIISCSDLVILPSKPSGCDAWAARSLVSLIKERQSIAEGTPLAAFVRNMATDGTLVMKEFSDLIGEFGFPLLQTVIHERVSYIGTLSDGNTVFQGKDKKAVLEVDSLGQEIMRATRGFKCI